MIIDLNLETDAAAAVVCRHCGRRVGDSMTDPMTHALRRERPSTDADPALFVNRKVELWQAFCPGCLTLLCTEITPADEPSYRTWSLA